MHVEASQRELAASKSPFSVASNVKVGAGKDHRLVFWMLIALATGFLAYVARMHEVTHDAFHEMALFREALVLGQMPQEDVFAYTPTVSPSVHHEWGTGAVLYFVTIGTGLGAFGLSLLRLLLIAALWLLLYRVARMRGAHPYIFALLAFFAFPVVWVGFATVRAQLFTIVFIAAQLYMHEIDRRGHRLWVILWLVMLVMWLNIHAGFVVGLGLITFHTVERMATAWIRGRSLTVVLAATWHLIAAAPLAAASLLVNPYGWKYLPYLVRAIGMDRPLIREWQPLWHTYAPEFTLAIFAISIILFAGGILALRGKSFWLSRIPGASFLALAAYMTLKHIRHGSIYGVIWLAYVPAWISRTRFGKDLVRIVEENRKGVVRVSQVVACTTLAFACLHHVWLPSLPPKQLYSTACFPTGAVDYLKQIEFRGNVLTPFHVGAYVSWEMYPDVHVSFDGRYEVAYQDQIMPEHNQFLDGDEGWWTVMEKYPTDAIIVHQQAPVRDKLEVFREGYPGPKPPTVRNWQFVYEDDSFLILAPSASGLPVVDRTGEELKDGAREAFSSAHAHWNRRVITGFAKN